MHKHKYAEICKKIMQKYAEICKYMHLPHGFTSIANICQNMQKICKICKHESYMHNMHLPFC